jgi:hypothetical protein
LFFCSNTKRAGLAGYLMFRDGKRSQCRARAAKTLKILRITFVICEQNPPNLSFVDGDCDAGSALPAAEKAMLDQESRRRIPELVRLAADPRLDSMTRTWVFEALRELTGQRLPDDVDQWRSWFKRISGHYPQAPEDSVRFLAWLEN